MRAGFRLIGTLLRVYICPGSPYCLTELDLLAAKTGEFRKVWHDRRYVFKFFFSAVSVWVSSLSGRCVSCLAACFVFSRLLDSRILTLTRSSSICYWRSRHKYIVLRLSPLRSSSRLIQSSILHVLGQPIHISSRVKVWNQQNQGIRFRAIWSKPRVAARSTSDRSGSNFDENSC